MGNSKYLADSLPDGGRKVFELYSVDCTSRGKQSVSVGTVKSNSFQVRKKGNTYQFADWSSDVQGDCVTFLEHVESLTTRDAILRVKALYNLPSNTASTFQGSPTNENRWKQPQVVSAASDSSSAALVSIEFRDFNTQELDYWTSKSSGLVTHELLRQYNVRPIESYTKSSYHSANRLHHYAFESAIGGYYKVLTPKRYDKDGKRIPAIYLHTPEAFLHKAARPLFRYSFGIEHLSGGVAFLCEGEADTLSLIAAGFQAFTYGGVQTKLNQEQRSDLLRRGVTRVVTVYDVDDVGIKDAEALRSHKYVEFPIVSATLPKLSGTKDAKDVCDYIARYGVDDDLRNVLHIAATSQVETRDTITRRGVTVDTSIHRIAKHIDKATQHSICNELVNRSRVMLVSPTGSGKTTAAIEIARAIAGDNSRVVLALPNIAAVSQLAESTGLPKMSSETGFDERALLKARSEPIVITTYDGLRHCGEYSTLIVDEVHQLANDYTYRRAAVRSVFAAMEAATYVLAMTATPEPLLAAEFNFSVVRCVSSKVQTLRVTERSINSDNESVMPATSKTLTKLNAVVSAAVASVRAGRLPVVRINNSKSIDKIKRALEQHGIDGVYSITSGEKARGISLVYKSIVERSLLPNDCQVLLCTSCIDTSVNIKGCNFEILIVEELSADNVVQFAARFRDMDSIDVTLLFANLKGSQGARLDTSKRYESKKTIAHNQAALFNSLVVEYGNAEVERHTTSSTFMTANATFYDGVSEVYKPCVAWCYSTAVLEAKEKTSDDLALALQSLSEFGIVSVEFIKPEPVSMLSIDTLIEASTQVEEHRDNLRVELIEELRSNDVDFLKAMYCYSKSPSIKGCILNSLGCGVVQRNVQLDCYATRVERLLSFAEAEEIVYRYCSDMSDGFSKPDALTLVTSTLGSNSHSVFKRHLLDLQRINTSDRKLSGQQIAEKRELERILAAFKEGERISGKEIVKRMKKACINYEVNPKSAVALFKALFASERSGKQKTYLVGKLSTVAEYCASYGVSAPFSSVSADHSPLPEFLLGDTSLIIEGSNNKREVSPSSLAAEVLW